MSPRGKTLAWAETHPFISFDFAFVSRIPAATWTLLGECSSKIEHISGTPLRKETADEMQQVFLAKGVHATTAIEGNTLSEEQVRKRLQGELDLPPSQEYLGREIDNIVGAYNFLIAHLRHGDPFVLTPTDLKTLNKMVLADLQLPDGVTPGEYREHSVTVSDYLAPNARFVPEMVSEGCKALNHTDWSQPVGSRFVVPLLRAIISHLYIAWIHPFGDGNGRTARAIEFDLLIRAGAPYICAHLLSDHYNRTRAAYYRALSAARQSPIEFVMYAVGGLRDSLREQIDLIRQQHAEVAWENHVHDVFRKDQSAQAQRQRRVALSLADRDGPVPLDEIPRLTPELAIAYSRLTTRTLHRDLVELRRRELIIPVKGGWTANIDLVKAFLPLSREPASSMPPSA